MYKLKIDLFFLLTSICFAVNGQEKSNCVLKSEDFFKQVYEIGKCELFDLRSIEEYNKNRLVDAKSAETKETLTILLKGVDKKSKIFLYCEIGKRSQECAIWLNSLGYSNVFQLEGGFKQWKKTGFPVDSEVIKK